MFLVPRAIESTITIDNLEFTPNLAIQNSTEFNQLAEDIEKELKNAIFDYQTLNFGAADISVKVIDFR